jgi:HAD superfamily hydrolase (TIGR01509 family)
MGSQARDVFPIDGVLIDLHGTLIDQGSGQTWIDTALTHLGESREVHPELAPFLDRIWENAREFDPGSARDLDADVHHAVFHKLIADFQLDEGFTEALYTTMLDPWQPYTDALPMLKTLRREGVLTYVLSNIGVPIDHVLDRTGISAHIDGRILSYEVGGVKPDPVIFQAALDAMNLPADSVLMVGDSPKDDAGAGFLGIRTLLLPRTFGSTHGLDLVTALVRASRSEDFGRIPTATQSV